MLIGKLPLYNPGNNPAKIQLIGNVHIVITIFVNLLYLFECYELFHISLFAVTFAATAIFAYWWVVPSLLWLLLWWRGNHAGLVFLEIICVYGYSLAIYIPISVSIFVTILNVFSWYKLCIHLLVFRFIITKHYFLFAFVILFCVHDILSPPASM